MTSILLTTELTNLSSEAKRKNNELRTAAEKSLQELKGIQVTSEQQLAADLSRRTTFIEPFLLACGTQTAKFASSGVTCLQRLVISRGLPKARLQETLQAFNLCTELGLDIQLKILQALPSLLQNYADDLKGDLLSGALEVCTSLQSAKVQTVSGVAAATLQQLVSSIFEKVIREDQYSSDIPAQDEVPGDEGPLKIRPAAFDAYRVLQDLILAAEERKTNFVQLASLSPDASLELIWSSIHSSPQLFTSHAELGSLVQTNLLPLITRALSERLSFAKTIRCHRILNLVLSNFLAQCPAECGDALRLLTQSLDPDGTPSWKRAATMEVLRDFFVDGTRVIEAYAMYDLTQGGKTIVQDILSSFVRLSTEKPSLIGLGQQSSAPAGPVARDGGSSEQTSGESAGGMAGMITSALGVAESNVSGISSKWSIPRTSCLEQLDKSDPPGLPETYIYALVLECLGSLSEGLAKVILPLTVQHERSKTKGQSVTNGQTASGQSSTGRNRSQSFRKRAVPLNPLQQERNAGPTRVKAVNGLVESCWPAVLATSSTFLNAALDDQYYRSLIKAYQRFAQVAGLLRLRTARDALMTTLGKAAVPPHVLNAATAEPPRTPTSESPRTFSNPKGLLSVDALVSQASTFSIDRDRRGSADPPRPMLTTRNLLCLRAQLNLAIALGPTLDTAFAVVVDTLRQADAVLSSTTPQHMVRQGLAASSKDSESPSLVQAFTNEVTAVEAAASRLLESTADYPNQAFINVLTTFCGLLHGRPSASPRLEQHSPPPTPTMKSRSFSGLTGVNSYNEMQMRDYKFVLPKLGSLAELNVARFVSDEPQDSGWNLLIEELTTLASNNATPKEARRSATTILCKLAAEIIAEVVEDEINTRTVIQRRTLAVLLRLIDGIYSEDGDLSSSDVDVQGFVVDALRAILERCGESLVAGWNRTIAILSSVFERTGPPPDRHDDEEAHIDWENVSKDLVSVQLGKAAFAATQLLCSDFLSALSAAVIPSLIELLHRFAGQGDDLNVALTTITMLWNVSDFLLRSVEKNELDIVSRQAKEADEPEEEIAGLVKEYSSAQWLLLLLRMQDIISTSDKEVRKAAFQTLCSIFKNNGQQLSPGAWDLTLRSIILRIAFYDSFLYRDDGAGQASSQGKPQPDEAISNAMIEGTSEIIAQHLELIEQVPHIASLWEAFLSRMEAYLDLDKCKLNAAVFRALHSILSRITTGSKTLNGPMYRTLHLWLKRNPALVENDGKESNQVTLIAYVDVGAELYRLTQQSMSTSQTRTLVENLYLSLRHSDGPRYGADISSLSPLQSKVFQLLKAIRSDTPSTLVVVAAKMITLHHDTAGEGARSERPTFVAMVSESIDWLRQLVLNNIDDFDLLDSGVIVNVLQNLRHLIEQKYLFKMEHKGTLLWRNATSTAVTLCKPILEQCANPRLDQSVKISVWQEFVGIASGIVKAKGIEQIEDEGKIHTDQLEDIESFKSIRSVLTPGLGQNDLPDEVRMQYVRALFEASVVHPTEQNEVPNPGTSPLSGLGTIRRGRVKKIPFSPREQMCYECLSELIALSSKSDGSAESKRLAQAAAPLTILRLAIPIRAYIADQPLRGCRPQPLSELEELLFCFKAIAELECETDALSHDSTVPGWSGEKSHLRYLYPLLIKAVGIAGDEWSGADEVLTPLKDVLESLMPWP